MRQKPAHRGDLAHLDRVAVHEAVRQAEQPNPGDVVELIDTLPVHDVDITLLPEHLQRALYDIFHLELRYDPATNRLTLRITVSADTAEAFTGIARNRGTDPEND